ncbi:LysR substrate-binding domain-containing protein [Aquibium sp. A9E412]|uniref:LysR family transcriptional regulator n=1 Tax=Aquibium sp. A9E412 TaxID=2976767 RepID=UPI0025B1DF72|nr:LysR family transcriptional regulator [Aquibium sp. A9E412]MDN2565080.1 LysR substrate-binding domain-containing protein [Aquibium sp. A9E412]
MAQPEASAAGTVTIRHLRAFLLVARHRSFTRAALALHVSQPALTMIVRQLEDIVGARLFDRTTRTVQLTPEALDFLPTAERLLADFDLAVMDIRATARQRRNRIAVAAVHSVATKLLPGVLARLAAQNPTLHVRIRDGNSSDVRRRIQRDEVDFGIGSKDADEPELEFVPFFRDELGLLVPRNHEFAARDAPVRWRELETQVFIGLSSDTATAPLLGSIPDPPASVRAPRYEVSTNSTLWALMESGIGVTTTPALSAPPADATLRFCRLVEPTVWRTVYFIRRRGRAPTPATEQLVGLLKQALLRHEDGDLIEVLDPA